MFMNVFLKILDMTRSASWMIPVVFAVRFLFRKLPKKYSYYLWMIVWIRLLVPFTIETEFSPVPYSEPVSESSVLRKTDLSVPESVSLIRENAVSVQTELPETAYSVSSAPLKDGVYRSRYIWLVGLAVSAAYSFASLISLNRKLRFSVPQTENIRICDEIESPFVLGVLRPVIYLPSSLSMEDSGCILMHERFHIKRKDPLLKFVSWIALTVHWFNPLVWLAYDCFQKDMEMSCDEEVIRLSGTDIRSSYAESLLALSVRQNRFSAPLAFTEGNPRPRIANLTVRKNTKKTAGIIAVSVCVLLSIVFMMTRGKGKDTVTVTDAGNDGIGMYADMDFSYGRNVRMIQIVADEWYQGEQTEYPVVTMRAQAGSSAQSIRFSFNTNGNEISVVCTVNGYMETCSIPLRDTASDVSGQAFSSYEINEKTELIPGGETSLAVLQMNSADGMHAFSVYSPVDGSVYAIALKAVCTGWDTYTPEDILYMDDDEVSEIAIWSAPGGSAEDVHNAADPQSFYKELRKHLTEISKISDEYGISKEDSEDIRYILDIRGAGNSVLTVMNCEGTPVLVNYSGKYAVNEEVYQFIEETYEEEKPAAGDLRIRPAEGETVMDAGYIAEQANVPGLDAGYDLCDAIALIRIKTIEGTDTYNEVTQQTTAPYTWGTFEVITPVRGELRPGVQYTFTRSGGIVPWMKYHQFMEAWSPESAEKSDRLMEETGTQTPAYVYFHKFDDIDIESGKTYLAMFENTEYQARRTDAWRIAWFEAGLREAQGGKVLNNTTGEWEDLAALISEMKK